MLNALLFAALALAPSPASMAQPPAPDPAAVVQIAAVEGLQAVADAAAAPAATAPVSDPGAQFAAWLAHRGAPQALAANVPPPCPNPLSLCTRCSQLGFGCCLNQATGCFGCC